MSYEIVRDRRFIRIDEERVIPLILTGSNNCTQLKWTGRGQREVLERYWTPFWGANHIISTKKDMIDWASKYLGGERTHEEEWFKWKGTWLVGKKIIPWIENGFKNAYTLEDYLSLSNASLRCEISLYTSTGDYSSRWETKNRAYPKTTEELVTWIDEFEKFDKGTADEKYAKIEFTKDEPLKIATPPKDETLANPYICKCGKDYVVAYDKEKRSLTTTKNKIDAKVFTDASEFEVVRITCAYFHRSCKAVSASSVLSPAPYYIKVSKGWYSTWNYLVKKKTSKSIYFTKDTNEALRFKTEKSALKYVASLATTDMCQGYEVCKIGD